MATMSTLCLCDLSDNDLRVLASLSARPQPAPVPPTPGLRLQPPVSWLRTPASGSSAAPARAEPRP
jgi:hypothetical protein